MPVPLLALRLVRVIVCNVRGLQFSVRVSF